MVRRPWQATRRPRIAVVRHSGYPEDVHIRRDMLALRDAGFAVDLFCDHDPHRPLVEHVDGITVFRIPPRHKRGGVVRYVFGYAAFPVLAAIAVAVCSPFRRYKWVEINNMPDWLMLAALVPRVLGAKVSLYSRDNMPQIAVSDYGVSSTHPAVRLLVGMQRVCARSADVVITTHEMARRTLVKQGVPAHKLVIIPNSPDESVFRAALPDSGKCTPQASNSAFRLVTHGTLVKRYGIETLLQAIHLLREQVPNIQLDIIGSGEYEESLRALAHSLQLEPHVRFTGRIPFGEVAPRLQEADLGVVPVWTDFFLTNKLVEYLALGLPAIITESAALRLYLDDTEVCYVEPRNPQVLADAILALYRDPARRAALAAAGHTAYLEHFAWERAKHEYLAVYTVGSDNVSTATSDIGLASGVREGAA